MITTNDLIRRAAELLSNDAELLAAARASADGRETVISRLTQHGAPRWSAERAVQAVIAWFNMIDDD